jgi:chorismate mutase
MFESILGGLVSDEKKAEAIQEIIKDSLSDVAEEYELEPQDIFFMIQPVDKDFNFAIFVYQAGESGTKKLREISLKEILGADE